MLLNNKYYKYNLVAKYTVPCDVDMKVRLRWKTIKLNQIVIGCIVSRNYCLNFERNKVKIVFKIILLQVKYCIEIEL